MILFKFKEFLNNISNTFNEILNKYGEKPAFWVITVVTLFIVACWGIRYLNKNK